MLSEHKIKKTKTASELRLLTETNTADAATLASVFGMVTGVSWLL